MIIGQYPGDIPLVSKGEVSKEVPLVVTAQPVSYADVTMDGLLTGQGVMLRQHTSQFLRCLCCQPNINWTLHAYTGEAVNFNDLPPSSVWMQEDAAWCDRTWSCWAPGCRPTLFRTVQGKPDDSLLPKRDLSGVITHSKGRTCGQNAIIACSQDGMIRAPMCCCLPYMNTHDGNGQLMGTSRYIFDGCLFVPKFGIYNAFNEEIYRVRPDVCCMGACVRPRCGGAAGRCCRIPWLIREPTAPYNQIGDATITDLWAGFKAQCCSRRAYYGIRFPDDATREAKATIVGAALLLDVSFYEQGE